MNNLVNQQTAQRNQLAAKDKKNGGTASPFVKTLNSPIFVNSLSLYLNFLLNQTNVWLQVIVNPTNFAVRKT